VKQGFIIPVFRHGRTAGPLAERLAAGGLPVILVDDGNDDETRALLEACCLRTPGLFLVSNKKNMGKGRAVGRGLEKAAELGLSHVLQIDADGQHDAGQADFFLKEALIFPDKVICGFPEFDASAPRGRVIGREISNFWARALTLSGAIKDALCGFRVYPVKEALRITRDPLMDSRMGFDAEILVRLYWNRIFPVFHPIKVIYPKDGISNFRMIRDNLHISFMFARLCLGMLIRLPLLIYIKIKLKEAEP